MQCPECDNLNTTIRDSRVKSNGTHRRRVCTQCKHRWTTVEVSVPKGLKPNSISPKLLTDPDARYEDLKSEIKRQHAIIDRLLDSPVGGGAHNTDS